MGPKVTAKRFSEDNTKQLLKLVKTILPAGGNDWKRVAVEYNKKFPDAGELKDYKQLKKKFYDLVNAKKPTGIDSLIKYNSELLSDFSSYALFRRN